ncbi:outer membrane beta-barrel protein [Orenia marismortui]|uniref:Outer membrane protein with beta-barrel domain n=1 Tax=Orenia marismortui TaxID=46469 RepID=A0A4R8H7R0_9FIRM|nr:outer membrane beta-barrel protein [Orenia marismortui]TDX51567.1 outer membrane protein with beta-barrel domain [Orenia marismortui]
MKKLIVALVALVFITTIATTSFAENSISFEILESDTSYKSLGGEFMIKDHWSFLGDYTFSRIDQYSIGLRINKLNLSIMNNIFNSEKLSAQLGLGYSYGSANLSSNYFPDMNVSSREHGLILAGNAEVDLDDRLSLFGKINYIPKAKLEGKIENNETIDEISDSIKKYEAKIGLKSKLAENLTARLGYNFTRYLDNINSGHVDPNNLKLKENFNHNQSGIFLGLESNF